MVTGGRPLRIRRGERGAAIFVVVMVLTMLTAIGVFAMRAASLAEAASGYDRQNSQNHYVGEYGMFAAVTELSSKRRNFYYGKMTEGKERCIANASRTRLLSKVPCYPIHASDVQVAVTSNFSGRPLFEPATTTAGVTNPGSLGPSGLDGDFRVEMTDPSAVGLPVAGSEQGGISRWTYYQVALTSVGQVRPSGDPASCVATSAGIAGNETGRAYVVIGPLLGVGRSP